MNLYCVFYSILFYSNSTLVLCSRFMYENISLPLTDEKNKVSTPKKVKHRKSVCSYHSMYTRLGNISHTNSTIINKEPLVF